MAQLSLRSGSTIGMPKCANLVVWFESVAQLVEHRPFKALVLGSSPSALTIASQMHGSPIVVMETSCE
jgi:hypothetical protein